MSGFVGLSLICAAAAQAADLIVSAQDGKFVRVDGKATFPQPAPPDSLVVIDAAQSPPAIVATVEGIEHTVQGPPQSVAITPDGKLAIVAAPTRYDYDAKKELFDNFLQIVDLESSPPKLIAKVDVGGHPNGLTINRDGTLLLAAAHDGTVKVLSIDGKDVKLVDQVKVAEKRLAGIAFTPDGKSAIVALRDENGAVVLNVDGTTVKPSKEKLSTGVNPYAVDVSSDGRWAVIGNTGVGGRIVADADVVTLVDVSKRPFRTVQQISVPATPEGLAISPDGKWIVVSSMAGSDLTRGRSGAKEARSRRVVRREERPGRQSERVARRRSGPGRRLQQGQQDGPGAIRRRARDRGLHDSRRKAGRYGQTAQSGRRSGIYPVDAAMNTV